MKVRRSVQVTDQELIRQIAKGNELAFSTFYDRYWDFLFMAANKVLNDREASKDVVQEVFLTIWEEARLGHLESIKAYLHQMVRYKVLMILRKGKVSEKHLNTLQDLVENTTEEQLNFQELSETIEHSIRSLPYKCQEVFRLSRVEHLTNTEIAERLSISVRTVETHISNALRQIRQKLDTSTPQISI